MSTTSNGSKNVSGRNSHSAMKARGKETRRTVHAQHAAASDLPRVRIILADSEAIFRMGMSKIFAQCEDLEVVAQTETLAQTLTAVATIPADIILFELGLAPSPADAVSEVAARALPGAKIVVVTQRA